ncbi:MAG: L-lactate dehydrogenase [Pseudomonadota bacterium]
MKPLASLVSVEDYRRRARSNLPRILFDYIDGGSYDEVTLTRNVEAFRQAVLTQRVMVDVGQTDSRVTLFGQTMAAPLLCAPVGFAGMYARRGEVQAARAARKADLPFCLSTVGICSLEEVTEGAGTPPWFQLYMIRDRDGMARLLHRARDAGCPVLVLTADLQTPGKRYASVRSGMMRQLSFLEHVARLWDGATSPGWVWNVHLRGRPHAFGNLDGLLPEAADFATAWEWIGANFDPTVSWNDLEFIRQHWDRPIVLKGVMAPEDARLCVERGVDGLVVSNHGGRQLDGGQASLHALPDCLDAVGGRIPVLMDGGVRSGLDVLKAYNAGAAATLIGRPWAYALGAGGEPAVTQLLESMKAELRTAQVLSATHTLDRHMDGQDISP